MKHKRVKTHSKAKSQNIVSCSRRKTANGCLLLKELSANSESQPAKSYVRILQGEAESA